MKHLSIVFMIVAVLVILGGCVRIEGGYVGLKAWELGDKRGTVEVMGPGRYALNSVKAKWWKYPTFKQNYVWTADRNEGSENDESLTFPIEGLKISVDIGVEFAVDREKVEQIFVEYRKSLDEITDGPMRNFVRDAILQVAKDYTDMEQFITKNEISDLVSKVEILAIEYFKPLGISVSRIYLVTAPRYPATVTASIEAKIKATQTAIQRENEVRETEAEARKVAARAKGESDAMIARATGEAESMVAMATAEAQAKKLLQASYSPMILQAMWIEKWDGRLPTTLPGDSDLMMGLK